MTTVLKIVPELRNYCINGNFDFWQRGVGPFAFTTANGGCLPDRFSIAPGTAGYTMTAQRSTDVPTFVQSNFNTNYSLLVTNTAATSLAAGDNNNIGQRIEGLDFQNLHGRKVRFQFWCKSSITGTFPLALRNVGANRSYVAPFTINSAATWEKKTFDIQMDTVGTWGQDNGIGLRMEIYLTAGSTFQTGSTNQWIAGNFIGFTGQTQWTSSNTGATFQITQVAVYPIDASSGISLPFVRAGRTIGHELAMCQRYCCVFGWDNAANQGSFGPAQCFSTSTAFSQLPFAVSMRSVPSLSSFTSAATGFSVLTSTGANNQLSTLTLSSNSTTATGVLNITAGTANLAGGNMTVLGRNSGNTTSIIVFDSEL